MRAAFILAGVAASVGLARAQPSGQELETSRLNREATALFTAIINDLPEPPGSCEIDAIWSDYGVPYDVARDAIDLRVHANLQSPDSVAPPGDVIGPAVRKGVVCDKALRDKVKATEVEAWRKAFLARAKGAKPPVAPSDFHRAFTFPIFDRDFQRAVLMSQGVGGLMAFDDKGDRKRTSLTGGGSALVYARDKTGWHKVKEIDVYAFD